jgi:hypothetical protein
MLRFLSGIDLNLRCLGSLSVSKETVSTNTFGAMFVYSDRLTNSSRPRVIPSLLLVDPLVDDASSKTMVQELPCLAI